MGTPKSKFRFGLPSLLLIMVVTTHYAPDLMGSFYKGAEVPAAKAWQLVMRGFEASLLYLIVWSLIPFRPVVIRLAGSLVCGWGFVESIQIPACRLAYAMTSPPANDTKLYAGLCDYATGVPIYMGTLLLVLLLFAFQYTNKK